MICPAHGFNHHRNRNSKCKRNRTYDCQQTQLETQIPGQAADRSIRRSHVRRALSGLHHPHQHDQHKPIVSTCTRLLSHSPSFARLAAPATTDADRIHGPYPCQPEHQCKKSTENENGTAAWRAPSPPAIAALDDNVALRERNDWAEVRQKPRSRSRAMLKLRLRARAV
jgi:hypothetical protein